MTSSKTRSTSGWMLIWGGMDLASVSIYAGIQAKEGRFPFVTDAFRASQCAAEHGALSTVLSLAALALTLSCVASGILLARGARWGVLIAIGQAPIRVLLVLPSLFFLLYMDVAGSGKALLVVIILTEALKMWTIQRSRFTARIDQRKFDN